mmetsp:Transcript_35993/g.110766  ORF Transcript_35993/g.110766 Transcript_35993/m.110766 type:complete len:434 (-) Transcript_35993:7-1308(-)
MIQTRQMPSSVRRNTADTRTWLPCRIQRSTRYTRPRTASTQTTAPPIKAVNGGTPQAFTATVPSAATAPAAPTVMPRPAPKALLRVSTEPASKSRTDEKSARNIARVVSPCSLRRSSLTHLNCSNIASNMGMYCSRGLHIVLKSMRKAMKRACNSRNRSSLCCCRSSRTMGSCVKRSETEMPSGPPRAQKRSMLNAWCIVSVNWVTTSTPVVLPTKDTKPWALTSSAIQRSLIAASLAGVGMAPCLPSCLLSSMYPASLARWQSTAPPWEKTSATSQAGAWMPRVGRVTSARPAGQRSSMALASSLTRLRCSALATRRTLCLEASRTASLTARACCWAAASPRSFATVCTCSNCPYQTSGHSRGSVARKAARSSPARSLAAWSRSCFERLKNSRTAGRSSSSRQAFTACSSSLVSQSIAGPAHARMRGLPSEP